MSGVSVSNLIIFIAAMGVAAAVAGTLVASVDDVSDSLDRESLGVAKQIDTDLQVISDAGSDAVVDPEGGSDGEVVLLVKNTGEIDLDPQDLDVLLDGSYVGSAEWESEVLADERWRPGAVVELRIDRSVDPGEHRVSLSINGTETVFEFYHDD
jgi:archaeal flagellar protein FlaG